MLDKACFGNVTEDEKKICVYIGGALMLLAVVSTVSLGVHVVYFGTMPSYPSYHFVVILLGVLVLLVVLFGESLVEEVKYTLAPKMGVVITCFGCAIRLCTFLQCIYKENSNSVITAFLHKKHTDVTKFHLKYTDKPTARQIAQRKATEGAIQNTNRTDTAVGIAAQAVEQRIINLENTYKQAAQEQLAEYQAKMEELEANVKHREANVKKREREMEEREASVQKREASVQKREASVREREESVQAGSVEQQRAENDKPCRIIVQPPANYDVT